MTSVASNPQVVCTPEEVTAPWLSQALGTEVRSVRTELVGSAVVATTRKSVVNESAVTVQTL